MTKKTVKVVKEKSIKVRNAGTLTESAFWGFIRSTLRNKSRFWKPVNQARINARRKYYGANKRQKWEYQCAECKNWFMGDEICVDHLTECGSLKCAEDLPGFVERLFCEVGGLQILCKSVCHKKKTDNYLAEKRKE